MHDVDAAWALAGAVLGGAGMYLLGYHAALRWVLGLLARKGVDLDGVIKEEAG